MPSLFAESAGAVAAAAAARSAGRRGPSVGGSFASAPNA